MGKPKIVKEEGGGFEPHPAGQFAARCIDVVDVGYEESSWGPRYKQMFVFFAGQWTEKEIEGEMKNLPLLVFVRMTATLSERGKMRPFLENWRGAPFTKDELAGFDTEKCYDKPAFIQVQHRVTEKGTYANISTIMPPPKGVPVPDAPPEYVRYEDREDWTGPAPHPAMSSGDTQADDWDSRGKYPTSSSADDEQDGIPW